MLLVDAYNVLHVTGVLPPHLAGLDAPSLAELIARSRAWPDASLICDGVKPRGWPARVEAVELRFAGPGRDADTLIERLIADAPDPRRLTVVSSDRRVKGAAKRARCKALSSEGFLRRLVDLIESPRVPAGSPAAGKPEVPLDAFALRRWLDEFGVSPEELRRMAGEARAPLLRSGTGAAEGIEPKDNRRDPKRQEPSPPPPSRGRGSGAGPTSGGKGSAGDLSDAQMRSMLAEALRMWSADGDRADLDLTAWLDALVNPSPRVARPSDGSSRPRR